MYRSLKPQYDISFPEGELKIPENPSAVVILCLGEEDSRSCPGIHFITQKLQSKGFATFIFDMLSKKEEKICNFHTDLVARRLIAVTRSLTNLAAIKNLPVGYLGIGSGIALAVAAAASLQHKISTIISINGRPDLAADHLSQIDIPVLLIAGQFNLQTVRCCRQVLHNLSGTSNLAIIVQETNDLFDEERVLGHVTEMTSEWFTKNLTVKEVFKRHPFRAMAS